jgi:hypothetical protein
MVCFCCATISDDVNHHETCPARPTSDDHDDVLELKRRLLTLCELVQKAGIEAPCPSCGTTGYQCRYCGLKFDGPC